MSQQDDYELTPKEKPEIPKPPGTKPKPGEPGWVEPVPIIEKADPPQESHDPLEFESEDVHKNKAMAILGYICFIIPLVASPKSKFARFHANQGLLSFILWWIAFFGVIALHFVGLVASRFIESIWILDFFVGCMIHILQPALLLGALVMMIIGIVHAANGEGKGLPLIGHFTIIK